MNDIKARTDHPCRGLSNAVRRAFETYAIGQEPRCHDRTRQTLMNQGLLAMTGSKYHGHFCGQPIMQPIYEVPMAVHMQWCRWCDENVADGGALP